MPKGVRFKLEQVVGKMREIEVKVEQDREVLSGCRGVGTE